MHNFRKQIKISLEIVEKVSREISSLIMMSLGSKLLNCSGVTSKAVFALSPQANAAFYGTNRESNKPAKPTPSFIQFYQGIRPSLLNEKPNASLAELTQMAGKKYNQLPDQKKEVSKL